MRLGAGSAEGFAYLFTGVLRFSKTINDFANNLKKKLKLKPKKNYREQMTRLKTYRFVRFMPAAVGLEESSQSWTWQK